MDERERWLGTVVTCPYCLQNCDALVSARGEYVFPAVGDATVCVGCGGIALFMSDGVRAPSKEEWPELLEDEALMGFRNMIVERLYHV